MKKRYRVYFNNFKSLKDCWSVDEGTIATEQHFAQVLIMAPSLTCVNLSVDNIHEPKAWLRVDGILQTHTLVNEKIAAIKGAA